MSRPAVIELHIEELVLRGASGVDRRALGAALEEELARLLATETTGWASAGGSRPSLDAGAVEWSDDAAAVGRSLAAALQTSLRTLAGSSNGGA